MWTPEMISRECWIANLIDGASAIADKDRQESRWLASDRYAWERPEELITDFFDGYLFDEFIEEFAATFTKEQAKAALALSTLMNTYNNATPEWLDPAEVLADPLWAEIRTKASEFIAAFKDQWPPTN